MPCECDYAVFGCGWIYALQVMINITGGLYDILVAGGTCPHCLVLRSTYKYYQWEAMMRTASFNMNTSVTRFLPSTFWDQQERSVFVV
jgi:hypothetical protein